MVVHREMVLREVQSLGRHKLQFPNEFRVLSRSVASAAHLVLQRSPPPAHTTLMRFPARCP